MVLELIGPSSARIDAATGEPFALSLDDCISGELGEHTARGKPRRAGITP
jgi:hypothetical protein